MKSYVRFIRIMVMGMSGLFWLLSGGFAQSTGTIKGRVTRADNDVGLAGTNIVLKQTAFGTSSGPDGTFEITGVPLGSYAMTISHIGFRPVEKKVMTVGSREVSLSIGLQPATIDLSEVLVHAERTYSTASSKAIRQFDLQIRPHRSAQDMLRLAPGLIIAQHAGGGKAEQIFMRGFDADHGTDVAIFVDGIPVNMVSHGHGQGYADLHFLIPEIVESVRVFKGPYFARFGNLATAGSVTFKTRDHVEHNLVQLEGGEFNTVRLTTVFQIPTSGEHQGAYIAGQFDQTDGPGEHPQNFQRLNLFGKFHTHVNEDSRIAFSMGAFNSGWDASGQIPKRAVEEGFISRFGAVDDLEGGTTSRQNVSLSYQNGTNSESEFLVQAYASRYSLSYFRTSLFS